MGRCRGGRNYAPRRAIRVSAAADPYIVGVATATTTLPEPVYDDAMPAPKDFPRNEIAAFCQRHHIRRLAVFGSALGENFGPESDIDVLVEFEPGHVPGLSFFAMEAELAAILGRPVDLATPGFLGKEIRDEVIASAREQYARP